MMTIDKNVLGRFEGLALSHIIIDSVTVEKKSASFDTYAGSLMDDVRSMRSKCSLEALKEESFTL